jgi:hypothetical protein
MSQKSATPSPNHTPAKKRKLLSNTGLAGSLRAAQSGSLTPDIPISPVTIGTKARIAVTICSARFAIGVVCPAKL